MQKSILSQKTIYNEHYKYGLYYWKKIKTIKNIKQISNMSILFCDLTSLFHCSKEFQK